MVASKDEVLGFIIDFKRIATISWRGIEVIPRKENRDALLELQITARIREEIILGLSVQNYCGGPEPDRDLPGFIWEFGTDLNGMEVYIKLKIAEVEGVKIAKCLSFHVAKSPQCYHHRTGGGK